MAQKKSRLRPFRRPRRNRSRVRRRAARSSPFRRRTMRVLQPRPRQQRFRRRRESLRRHPPSRNARQQLRRERSTLDARQHDPADAREAGTGKVEPVAHERPAREPVHVVADRSRRIAQRAPSRRLPDRSRTPRRRCRRRSSRRSPRHHRAHTHRAMSLRAAAAAVGCGQQPERVDDAPHEPAAAPAIRQHCERELTSPARAGATIGSRRRSLRGRASSCRPRARAPTSRGAYCAPSAFPRARAAPEARRRDGTQRIATGRPPSTRGLPTASAPRDRCLRSLRDGRTRPPACVPGRAPSALRTPSRRARAARGRASPSQRRRAAARRAQLPSSRRCCTTTARSPPAAAARDDSQRSPAVWLRQRRQSLVQPDGRAHRASR